MIIALFSFFISLAVVIFGAKLLLAASISLSRFLRLPEMVVGATLVSLITTMPENLVSIFASVSAHRGLALGDVVGSGLVNLGLIFGIVLLAGHGQGEKEGRGRRRSLILFCLVLLISLWLLIFGKIGSYGGAALILAAFVFLGYTFWYTLKESGESLKIIEIKLETHPKVIFKFFLGALLLILGARFLVSSGVSLAQILGLPEILIGITLVAVGTSLPELATALTALFSGHEKLSLGNLTGATVLTFTLALGLVAVISGVEAGEEKLKIDFLALLLFSGLTLVFAHFPKLPQRILGGILVISYFCYLGYLFL
ncbi:MAG: sodium:calcium antiporter [Patescibacteria group bacterium]